MKYTELEMIEMSKKYGSRADIGNKLPDMSDKEIAEEIESIRATLKEFEGDIDVDENYQEWGELCRMKPYQQLRGILKFYEFQKYYRNCIYQIPKLEIIDYGFFAVEGFANMMENYNKHEYVLVTSKNSDMKFTFFIQNGTPVFVGHEPDYDTMKAFSHTIQTEYQIVTFSVTADKKEIESYSVLIPRFKSDKEREKHLKISKKEFVQVLRANTSIHNEGIESFTR